MKKTLFVIMALSMLCFCSTQVFAGNDSGTGEITLTNAGAGPNLNVVISAGTCVAYTSDAAAGGYDGTSDDGQVMAVITGSGKADPDLALYFAVRSSQDPNNPDDNQVYQTSADGTVITPDETDGCESKVTGTDYPNDDAWSVRGGS